LPKCADLSRLPVDGLKFSRKEWRPLSHVTIFGLEKLANSLHRGSASDEK
jgi:hypothetical protein